MGTTLTKPHAGTFGAFLEACKPGQYRRLLTDWPQRTFYTAFIRLPSGDEYPAVFPVGSDKIFAASTSKEALADIIYGGPEVTPGQELVIRPVALADLSRSAMYWSITIAWIDQQHLIEKSVTELLGKAAIVETSEGRETVHLVEPCFFEAGQDAAALSQGAAQLWYVYQDDHELLSGTTLPSILVYDDHIDWKNNPGLPELTEHARPKSALSKSGKALFDRMQQPVLAISPEDPENGETAPETVHGVAFVNKADRKGFSQWRHQVDQEMIPPASEIKLDISQHEESAGGEEIIEQWTLKLRFPTAYGQLTDLNGLLVEPSALQAHESFPDRVGVHPVTEAFRERLVTHVAWLLFGHARRLWPEFSLNKGALHGLFPSRAENAYSAFMPDYEDTRYPCLARLQFGSHELPVLVTGQIQGDLVCRLLGHEEVPENEIPALLKNRSEIIRDGHLYEPSRPLTIRVPDSVVDFPSHWYRSARLCREHLIRQTRQLMLFNALLDHCAEPTAPYPTEPHRTDWASIVSTLLLGGLIGGVLIMFQFS